MYTSRGEGGRGFRQLPTPKKRGGKASGKRVLTTAFKQRRFLEEFGRHANISLAARASRIDRHQHYEWLQTDSDYAARFAEAHQAACDAIDAEIFRRGVTGVLEPVWFQGQRCGTVRRYDSTLLIFFAKALQPAKYREHFKAELVHEGAMKITAGMPDLARLSDAELEQLEALMRRCSTSDTDHGSSGEQAKDESPDQ